MYLLLFNMQTDLLTAEALRSILDEKLAPLKTEIAEVRNEVGAVCVFAPTMHGTLIVC